MKKNYAKPDIMFESFSLCTSIASICAVKTHTPSYGNCGYVFGPWIRFSSDVTGGEYGCNFYQNDGEGHDGLCYHVPTELTSLFNS